MSDVSLKEHIEAQIKWVDRYFLDQIKTIQEKTREAKEQIDKRLEGMNEFRDALKDAEAARQREIAKFATSADLASLKESLDGRLKLLEMRDARIAGMAAVVAVIVSIAVSLAAAIIVRLL